MPKAQIDHYKLFCDEMEILSRRYERGRIFSDFLTMALCALHQINIASRFKEQDPENEALFEKTKKPYSEDEQSSFSKLLGIVQSNVYDNPYSDLAGAYFTDHITQGHNGQYFTPDSLCEAMVRLQGADEGLTGQRVLDPACGSGRLLLKFAEVSPRNYFYANDVNMTCAKMTALNFMLNGLRGEVACMNSLSMEWYKSWMINMPVLGVQEIAKERSMIWRSPPEKPPPPELKSEDSDKFNDPKQLTFF